MAAHLPPGPIPQLARTIFGRGIIEVFNNAMLAARPETKPAHGMVALQELFSINASPPTDSRERLHNLTINLA